MNVLVSGTTGGLGDGLVLTLLSRFDMTLFCTFRSQRSYEEYVSRPSVRQHQSRIRPLIWDLTCAEEPAGMPDTDELVVVHCAADVSWIRDLGEVQALNVDGTLKLAQFVSSRARHARFIYVSTAATARDRSRFNTAYEATKATADRELRAKYGHRMEIITISPSLIVGDSQTGYISRFKSIYPLMRLMARFEPPMVIGNSSFKVDVVPLDWVVDEIIHLITGASNADDVVCTLGSVASLELRDAVAILQERINLYRRNKGLPPRKPPRVVSRDEYDFLLKVNDETSPFGNLKMYRRLFNTLHPYTSYSEHGEIREPRNTVYPCPVVHDFLAASCDYWLRIHGTALS